MNQDGECNTIMDVHDILIYICHLGKDVIFTSLLVLTATSQVLCTSV